MFSHLESDTKRNEKKTNVYVQNMFEGSNPCVVILYFKFGSV